MPRVRASRRQFLKATGAAVAMPHVIASGVLGEEGRPPASERVTMGFIGVGHQAGGHLYGGAWTYLPGGYVARDDVQVLAVCDIARDRRELALDKVNGHYARKSAGGSYRSAVGYVDFRELLARPDIDAVLIGTPIHWHALMSIMAAKAGKDVYCEKPTALTVQESRATLDAVRRYGRVYQAGTQQRSEYGGKFRLAAELVRSGRIGKLQAVYAYEAGGGPVWQRGYGESKPVPPDYDWELFLGPAPWRPYGGGRGGAHDFGNGPINWGQHHYDIVQWTMGADDTGPVELGHVDGKLAMKYANGVVVYGCPYPDPTIGLGPGVKFAGEGGAVFVGSGGVIAVDRNQILSNPTEILRKPIAPDEFHVYYSNSHSGNFLECVRTRKKAICDIQSTHRAASLMLLGGIADQLRRTLRWDPVREQFIDDAEANGLLSMAYRPPWRLG